jgi:poly(U)-binding-splicing factor PUF60
MNGFDLGGQHLQVGRCITPPDALTYLTMQISQQKEALPNAAAVAAATATAKIQAREILEV